MKKEAKAELYELLDSLTDMSIVFGKIKVEQKSAKM